MVALKIAAAALIIVVAVMGGMIGYVYQQATKLPRMNPASFVKSRLSADKRAAPVVVLVGDSITHGAASASYVDLLAERPGLDGFLLVNAGINGLLAHGVVQRLDEIIRCAPDFITILIGTNDAYALLSEENSQRYVKQWDLPQMPDSVWFRENLVAIIEKLQAETDARLAVLSLPTIGEDLDSIAYRRGAEHSQIIKQVATERGVTYLPLQERMVDYLRTHPSTQKYPVEAFRKVMYVALAKRYLLGRSYDEIAADNGFLLHPDHLHLSEAGAAMVADLIEGFIRDGAIARTGSGAARGPRP
jgi:lysophospholipase L1-like esterase